MSFYTGRLVVWRESEPRVGRNARCTRMSTLQSLYHRDRVERVSKRVCGGRVVDEVTSRVVVRQSWHVVDIIHMPRQVPSRGASRVLIVPSQSPLQYSPEEAFFWYHRAAEWLCDTVYSVDPRERSLASCVTTRRGQSQSGKELGLIFCLLFPALP